MKVLGVIPARGGSKGVRRKNILPLAGRPVIYYTIRAALDCPVLDKVVVSTENDRIATISSGYGVQVIKRPRELATDLAPIDGVLRHAVRYLEQEEGFSPDIVVLLYANVAVRDGTIIDKAVNHLVASGADSVISVSPVGKAHPYWMLKLVEGDHIAQFMEADIYRRQDLPPLYLHDGAVSAVWRRVLMEMEGQTHLYAYLGRDVRAIVQEDGLTVDIDSDLDFRLAEHILLGRRTSSRRAR